jgi:uncharacterized protein
MQGQHGGERRGRISLVSVDATGLPGAPCPAILKAHLSFNQKATIMPTEISPLRIAIVGGGVAGLSSAYYLLKQARSSSSSSSRVLQIDVFERKTILGGNADTVVVDLGNYIDGDGKQQAYLRWADLGVNDVNLATYERLKAVMEEIGYLDRMKPLQDTTSYFNAAGTLALTDDAALRNGVSDPAFSLANADGGRLAPLASVVHRSALDLLDSITPDYTVQMFFDACVEQPQEMLAAAAKKLGILIDWNDTALPDRMRQVRDVIYYPRIAAMYFTDDRGPQALPLSAPFEYYRLQEGGVAPDRRYFDHGAQTWLEALAAWLVAQSGERVRVTIHTDAAVAVQVFPGYVHLRRDGVQPERYDLCVLAAHADDTMALLDFDASMTEWRKPLSDALTSVRYTYGYAVCHTYDGLLPNNRNLWRTYNVLQRSNGDSTFPYRMTYVENLHQNDPANLHYDKAGLPQFFVSLVDSLNQIPRQAMLDRVQEPHRIEPRMLAALPQATRHQLNGKALLSGYRSTADGLHRELDGKAWTMFKHNVLDAQCIAAQQAIESFNIANGKQIAQGRQPACALLFGGGWSNGAGLQEQCLAQSAKIAAWIAPALHTVLTPASAVHSRADAAAA